MGKRKTLGRGLGAILDEVEEAYKTEAGQRSESIAELDIDKISPNPYQPRQNFDDDALDELAESLKRHGLLQPIVVMEKDGEYQLIAGERRLRASKRAGFDTIRAIIADPKLSQIRELALIENIQRENLNPIELALSYKELISDNKITQEELATIIHKSRAQITNTLRLLNLTSSTQEMIVEGKISQGHAKVLVGLDGETEEKVVNTIIGNKLNVRDTEKLIKSIKGSESKEVKSKLIEEINTLKYITKKLTGSGFNAKANGNKLTISFADDTEAAKFYKIIE
jgi:ParB family chromosome partitioning protein